MAKNRIRFSNDFILKNERVGINTTEPRALLDVGGDLYVSGISTISQTSTENLSLSNSGIAVTAILDEDDLISNRDDALATQQSIKSYVDNRVGNVDLNFSADSGIGTVNLNTEIFSIAGTSNEIETIGSGNTITIGLPNDITISNDLTIIRNLDVYGNITVGGTTAIINADQLQVKDKDIVLGITTDAFGNDVSTDVTANHGGIAIASTEGTPLSRVVVTGIETLPATYKKIMWFKSDTFSGVSTDAWMINYGVSIGNTTNVPTGTRLAVGDVLIGQDDITAVRNVNATGIVTVSDLYVNGALYDANNSRGNLNEVLVSVGAGLGVTWKSLTAGEVAGSVEVSSATTSTPYYIIGVEDATGVTSSFYTDTDLVLTGDGRLGIGSTNPTEKVDVIGNVKVSGLTTTQNLYVSGISTFISEANFDNNVNIEGTVGIGTIIDIIPYDTLSNGTLSFEGSAGQLFSITNNLTSGSIFSINDASGIPSIDVDADGTIQLAPFGSAEYIGIGKTNPTEKVDVIGNVKVSGLTTTQNLYVTGVSTVSDLYVNGALYDANNSRGNLDEVLVSVGAGLGVTWKSLNSGEIDVSVGVNSATTSTPYYIIGVEDATGVTSSFYTDTDVVLTGDGRLGIGTTNPTTTVDITGNLKITSIGATIGENIVAFHTTSNGGALAYRREDFDPTDNLVFSITNGPDVVNPDLVYVINDSNANPLLSVSNSGITTIRRVSVENDVTVGTTVQTPTVDFISAGAASTTKISAKHIDSNNGSLVFQSGISTNHLFSVSNQPSDKIYVINDANASASLTVYNDGIVSLANSVGIGTTNPTQKLDVVGNVKVTGDTYISGNTGIGTTNPTYKLQVVGDFAATTKSFSIPHPTKEGMTLRYGSLESPYHGIRLTGSSIVENGKCIVELPDYIHKLVKEEGVNIQLTNIRHGKVLWVESIDISHNNFMVMTESTDGSYEFYWDFTAIRNDIDEMVVEY